MYKATKTDGGATQGQTDWAVLGESKGTDYTVTNLAPGAWKFQLRGYLESSHTNLVYESTETSASLEGGKVSVISFTVGLVDGANGSLVINKPALILGSTAFQMTCTGVYQGTKTVTNLSSTTNGPGSVTLTNVQQGLWKLTFAFVDPAINESLGECEVTALVLNGGTTTVTLTYEAETGFIQANVATPTISDWTRKWPPEVGDIVAMGTTTWKVLSVDTTNRRALVISENILGTTKYNGNALVYSSSTVRSYLRSDSFYTAYGLDKAKILSVNVTSSIENTTITESGEDKAFLLSRTEVGRYFANNAARVATYNGTATKWWVRHNGSNSFFCVDASGAVVNQWSNEALGFRPAFWYNY